MKIKDIVNRDLVNLANCESEPIHIPGSIQLHGFLLGLDTISHCIDYCSANTAEFISITPAQLLGKCLKEIVTETEFQNFIAYVSQPVFDSANPLVFTFGYTPYNTTVHKSGNTIILEFEPFPDGSITLPNLYAQIKKFVSFMERAKSLQGLCQDIAAETRAITGYDRVMVYKFDKDYNGEVFAESKAENIEPFLGLHYPHTDIPVQARQLYLRNLLRMIVDVNYTPVPLLTIDNGHDKQLDLSLSVLRSVSPIHIEYLKNMGVGATLTISLILDGKLWGLIACHHYSVKNIPHYTRLAAQMQGHFLTSQIKVREAAEEYEHNSEADQKLQQILQHLTAAESFLQNVSSNQLLLQLVNATGVAVVNDGKIYLVGHVPERHQIMDLVHWLAANDEGALVTSKLSELYAGGEEISHTAAGIIYQAIGKSPEDCIIWFRNEVEKTINWAGDPAKAIVKDANGLSPRKSFELWKEFQRFQSSDWSDAEIKTTAKLAYALQRQFHLSYVVKEESRYRMLSQKLQTANEELANINWISTHDLNEPLRKIQMFASKILIEPDITSDVQYGAIRIQKAGERMRRLINDILSYSRVRDVSDALQPVDLNKVLQKIIADCKDEISAKQAVLDCGQLPVVYGIEFLIEQLFANVIGNALKFTAPGVSPYLKISAATVKGENINSNDILPNAQYHAVAFTDRGIGFNPEYKQKIFEVFQRLHDNSLYPGTGIGLAISKKIMDNHFGTITADGQPDKLIVTQIFLVS